MKVTVLREKDMAQLIRSYKAGQPAINLHTEKAKCQRPKSQSMSACMGFLVGSMATQIVIWFLFIFTGMNKVHVKVDMPKTPVDVSLNGNNLYIAEKSLPVHSNNSRGIQNSILLSAMLEIAQHNLQKEIQNDGFILVDPDNHLDQIRSMVLGSTNNLDKLDINMDPELKFDSNSPDAMKQDVALPQSINKLEDLPVENPQNEIEVINDDNQGADPFEEITDILAYLDSHAPQKIAEVSKSKDSP